MGILSPGEIYRATPTQDLVTERRSIGFSNDRCDLHRNGMSYSTLINSGLVMLKLSPTPSQAANSRHNQVGSESPASLPEISRSMPDAKRSKTGQTLKPGSRSYTTLSPT